MKISRTWLQNYIDAPLPATQALCDALTFHAFEIDGVEKVGDDEVLDVKVTPNRGHDCLSHRGIARELAAILKLPWKQEYDPFFHKPDFSKKAQGVSVAIADPALCKRYIAAHIKGVKIGPSPEWLKSSLGRIGQRSINNVVDATNLVMFNIGQPLHAFDAKRLGSLEIGVRSAREGEQMEALDQKTYALNPTQLVITAADRPVGIAGIKGGLPDRIDETTTELIIESATFDGVSIRKSAQALKLRTDASARFEQVLSPELAAYGMAQVVQLITTLAGGEVEGYVDTYPAPQRPAYASVTLEKINSVLGTGLTGAEVADAFTRLGFAYKEQDGVFEVQAPFERLDIALPEDLVEEVARIAGYDRIPSTPLPPPEKPAEINQTFAAAEAAREELLNEGYSEVYTSVFVEAGERVVLNKVDGVRPYLRDSLLPSLQEALNKNKPNKDLLGLKELKLFEIGTVWKGGGEAVVLGTISEKEGARETQLSPVQAARYEELPLSQATRFLPFSKYPYIVRDIAAWVPEGTDAQAVLADIKKEAGGLAHKVTLFDTFSKESRTSLAFRIIFQSFERTLTEAEANEGMEKVSSALKAKGFEIR